MKIKFKESKKKLKKFILEEYNIDVKSLKLSPHGSTCYSYIITNQNNKNYFLKILIRKKTKHLNLTKLREKLRSQFYLMIKCKLDFISYPILTLRGDFLSEFNNHPIIIYDYIEGENGDWDFNEKQLIDYGEKLAKLHQCIKFVDKKLFPKDDLNIHKYELKLNRYFKLLQTPSIKGKYNKKLKKLLLPKKEIILKLIQDLYHYKSTINFNKHVVLCHTDAIAENLIINKNNVSIIDLEDLCFAPLEKDVWLYVSNIHFKPFMEGYKKVKRGVKLNKKTVIFYHHLRLVNDLCYFVDDALEKTNKRTVRNHSIKQIIKYILFELNQLEERIQEFKDLI